MADQILKSGDLSPLAFMLGVFFLLVGCASQERNIATTNSNSMAVVGGLDRTVIEEYIQRHIEQFRTCYKGSLADNPKLEGRLKTQFQISPTGRVSTVQILSSTLNSLKTESCIRGVLSRIVFPEPLGGTVVEVTYPFNFTPKGAGVDADAAGESHGGGQEEFNPSPYLLKRMVDSMTKSCCKVCRVGKACGNSCISRGDSCHQPAGCACDSE